MRSPEADLETHAGRTAFRGLPKRDAAEPDFIQTLIGVEHVTK